MTEPPFLFLNLRFRVRLGRLLCFVFIVYFFIFLWKYTMAFYDKLCKPAQFYLLISLVSYTLILIQNLTSPNQFCLGSYSCESENKPLIMIGQLLYIAFWTWLLNIICKINTTISWAIVLLPFVLFFIILLALLFN
jgi:hypothetical protein